MKKFALLLIAFSSVWAMANDIKDLNGSTFKAINCKTCDLEFSMKDGKLTASMLNWKYMGRTVALNMPVILKSLEDKLIIKRSATDTCSYTLTRNWDQSIRLIEKEVLSPDTCPDYLTRTTIINATANRIENTYNFLAKTIYSPKNCQTCEVVFEKKSKNNLVAKMINWGFKGNDYASNIAVEFLSKRDRLKLTKTSGEQCFYELKRNYKNDIISMEHLKTQSRSCPKNLLIKR